MKKLTLLILILITTHHVFGQRNNINLNANVWFLGLQYERVINKNLTSSVTIGFPRHMFIKEKHIDESSSEIWGQSRQFGFNHKLELNYFPFAKEDRLLHGFNIGVFWLRKYWRTKHEYLNSEIKDIRPVRTINTIGPRIAYQWVFESGFNFSLNTGVMFLRNVEKTNPINISSNFHFAWPELEASIGYSF